MNVPISPVAYSRSLSLLACLVATATVGMAAPAQKPAKPAPKKPTPPKASQPAAGGKQTIVLGTKQLAGDFGQFGQTYTIGDEKTGSQPINFTLDRAEYSAAPFVAGNWHIAPKAEEKLLVLHFTVHNPLPTEQTYDWSSLKFTVVDAKDVNHEAEQVVVREGTREESVSLSLKPAQKLAVQAVIVVPAEKVVPKLIVQRSENAAVIRYDLRGKVAALPAPLADPADTTGATLRTEVPAATGVYHPVGIYDAKLESVSFTNEPLGGNAPEEGNRHFVALFTLRNAVGVEHSYNWGDFKVDLTDTNGDKYEYNQWMLKVTQDKEATGTLRPGQEVKVRFFFSLPNAAAPKTLELRNEGDGRIFVFDVSSATP